jgi:PAS domain S-box-containing protein
MNHKDLLFSHPVDLTNCDREPIQIPGSIQPHGLLFVLQEPQLKILQVSYNTWEILGIHPQKMLGKNLKAFLDSQIIKQLKKKLGEGLATINPLKLSINTKKGEVFFDGILHRSEGVIILELEPVTSKEFSDFFSLYHLVQSPIATIQKTRTLHEVCQALVEEVRKLTGFDRVMMYKFDAEEAGSIVAEDKLEELIPYLGLHYPASDIPQQARHLYRLNLLRLIPDVNYQPVELFPVNNPVTNQPLDLSFSVLRSVSPIHIEYLKNMDNGVGATLSISLIRNQKLWGLITCHHQSPKYVPYEIRTACQLLGKVMALELASKEDNERLDYRLKLNSIQSKFVEAISQEESFVNGLLKERSNLVELVGAQGSAIYEDETLTIIGKTPDLADIHDLINWLKTVNQDIFHTDSLPKLYPAAEKYREVASGLLAISISPIQKHYILWFRPEVIQTVNWAGNPHKPVEVASNGELRLTPRKSFELWQETVLFQSLPWQQCEIEIALELRSAIVGIVLHKAEEIAKVNQQLTLALSAAKMGIWDWDLLTDLIIWSRGHEQLFGMDIGTFDGTYKAFEAFIYPEDRAAIALAVDRSRWERQDYEHQFRVVWPDGSIHWIEGKGKFLYDNDGNAVRMLGTVVEISDRKARESQLRLQESVVISTNDAVIITETEPYPLNKISWLRFAMSIKMERFILLR